MIQLLLALLLTQPGPVACTTPTTRWAALVYEDAGGLIGEIQASSPGLHTCRGHAVRLVAPMIFADGFESGDLSAWEARKPSATLVVYVHLMWSEPCAGLPIWIRQGNRGHGGTLDDDCGWSPPGTWGPGLVAVTSGARWTLNLGQTSRLEIRKTKP